MNIRVNSNAWLRQVQHGFSPEELLGRHQNDTLVNIKGDFRRRKVLEAINSGSAKELGDDTLQESLPEDMREAVGKIHPTFVGGEYLPDYDENEVEIARVRLMSTTADVFSISARHDGKYIHYRVVDE